MISEQSFAKMIATSMAALDAVEAVEDQYGEEDEVEAAVCLVGAAVSRLAILYQESGISLDRTLPFVADFLDQHVAES